MINRIIGLCVRNKFLVFTLVGAACLWGTWAMMHQPVDAMPDLSETQVIILSRWDRSPDIIEDQVTYPIISAMTGAPHVKTVRGISDFGFSYVYVIFEEGTDLYWARSRTLEYLSSVTGRLPEGVRTELGPDATGLGWVFQYVLKDESGKHSLGELRSYQDWYLKYYLKAVPGVADVASLGGFTQQYQVNVDPNRLRSYGIPISRVADAVRSGNRETGARLLEFGGAEYMIRGRGYMQSPHDIEEIALASVDGTPIRIRDIGKVVIGPDIRRGASDLDGSGEVVSGIVIMRDGDNALDVIGRVKSRLKDIEPGLPSGVKVVPVYDRAELIQRAISNARLTLIEVILTVVVIILIFLWHFPSAVIPVVTIPVAVLLTFIPLHYTGVSINVMSLAGLAIACGELVDAAIVVGEQTHKKLESYQQAGLPFSYRDAVLEAVHEVAGPTFFALLVIAVAFLPVLVLEGQEGKLFRPLAYTKNFAMLAAAALAITFDPALRLLMVRQRRSRLGNSGSTWQRFSGWLLGGRIRSQEDHPITGPLMRIYDPVVRWTLRWKWQVIAGAVVLVLLTIPLFWTIGSEFMPSVDEGSLLYMPSTLPGISIGESQKLLQVTDRILKTFPEVDHVMGKTGRADTATDPAPLSMLETVIVLKPQSEWRKTDVWYSSWAPHWLLPALRHVTADHIPEEQLVAAMNDALHIPGLSNSWTMPIRGRIDMLSTGIRTPVGLKIQGSDLAQIQQIGHQLEQVLNTVPGTRSAFAERTGDGYFLDIVWNRDALARYGLSVDDAQSALSTAVGGDNVTTLIDGRARYPVNVRYLRDFRSDLDALGKVLISTNEKQIPLSELAAVHTLNGPAMIRNENGLLTGYVFVDIGDRPIGDYVAEARQRVQAQLPLPAGYSILWSGQYESAERVRQRLIVIVPVTIAVILFLLYCNTRSVTKTLIVVLAVPFSAVGALWIVYALGYNMSIAVWLGIIALLGIDAETGVFMLLYLDLAFEKARRETVRMTVARLHEAIVEGAAKRLRPKFMTFATMSIGLIPILWSTGAGSEIMKRIAAPMVGGIVTSFILELLVYPAVYLVWREAALKNESRELGNDEIVTSGFLGLHQHERSNLVGASQQQP
jgi:copper/silver efflux system protein